MAQALLPWLAVVASGSSTRLVVVPDAHGDRKALQEALGLAAAAEPVEGTTVVSLGDSVDRGPDPQGCYELLETLKATRLLGNHDWLNLAGVAPRDDPKTPHYQEDLFAPYVSKTDRDSFGGWKPRQVAFSPQGELGASIRANFELMALLPSPWHDRSKLPPLHAAATLLMHAGIMYKMAKQYKSVDEMIAEGRDGLKRSMNGDNSVLFGALFDHVLQDRSLAYGKEKAICSDLEKTLTHLGAARLVVGHTPQESRRAGIRCGGRLVLLDVAMSRWLMDMRNEEALTHPVALELKFTGSSGEEKLTDAPRIYYHDRIDTIPPSMKDEL
jgi:hypothetical protein